MIMYQNTEETVSVGHWIGIFFLSMIPCVNLVLLFVWAFGGTPKRSLKNYARAQLLLAAIALGVAIVVAIISAVFSLSLFSGIFDSIPYN